MAFLQEKNKLIYVNGGETVQVEPWGENSFRVRATKTAKVSEEDWALLPGKACDAKITVEENTASIVNGKIKAVFNEFGWLSYYNQKGETLLEEFWRVNDGGEKTSALAVFGREFRPIIGSSDYKIKLRFEGRDEEKIYGLGQRQERQLNMKGCSVELAQRNSQASVPFALSNLGYGILWNNPAIGNVTFANNVTIWEADCSEHIDIWITAGDTPAEIEEAYATATGKTPMMPDFATGFWQCKLRYTTQEQLLEVAREYKRRELPISVIVCDFFHWTEQGEWKFDPEFWPDPKAMVDELKEMGIELMVSIWPTVDVNSENYEEMRELGYLVRSERATPTNMNFMGNEVFYDAMNPAARKYVWEKAKKNYYGYGIKVFWLDEAEPDYMFHYDFDNFRYYNGPAVKVSNFYPFEYAKTFFEGMEAEGQENILNLIRCVWAGSQRYGTLLWSGDVHSTFECLRRQFAAGLNTGISGIPWWTTDIGGFTGGDIHDPKFHELLVRWFQFGLFCPVTRLHGFRLPIDFTVSDAAKMFNEPFGSGAENELWSYGEDVYEMLKTCTMTREALRPYVKEQMKAAHEKGTPVIRPLFYDFPDQKVCWDINDEYMFGPDILVAPVLYEGMRNRSVYLPEGKKWKCVNTGMAYEGGTIVECDAPLDTIPVFTTNGMEFEFVR
ncbi:glycoside hydrolase family 31 protein [Anaerocolumna jejuensis]|uniref:glycoside hydrolase family 31 protein n=1 Tax=Anaerocolumna jejuensis TaxID=259063 RepID=UPI003F7C0487